MARYGGRSTVATMGLMALAACMAFAQAPPSPATGPAPAIATVGSRRVTRAEFEQRAAQAMAEYRSRNSTDVPAELQPAVRRQLLETLIRRELLVLEVERRGLLASAAEAEAQLKRDPYFQLNGTFNEAKFLAIKSTSPVAYEGAIREMRLNLGARKLGDQLEKDSRPGEQAMRSHLSRTLGKASIDYLALRRADFNGAFPEPREREILEDYRNRASEFRRPDRAELSVSQVNEPALPDSLANDAGARRAWTERLRRRADSALVAIRAGATLEAATASFGVPRTHVVIVPGNVPGYWRGDERVSAALFGTRPGTVYPEPIPASSGWLIVRVDDVTRAHVAPLQEVAGTIRARLRAERSRTIEDVELRALYARTRDSLATTAYRVRYAVVDTASLRVPEPGAADLDRYYRSHLADYTAFDNAAGRVVEKPLDAVRDDVRSGWKRERRVEQSNSITEQLRDAWGRGRRDRTLERPVTVREAGPAPLGAPLDSTVVGRLLGDSLRARGGALGVGVASSSRGNVVFHVHDVVRGYAPSFEQSRAALLERRDRERAAADEVEARRAFEAAPSEFATTDMIHYSRFIVPKLPPLQVPLTRRDVERYHREHIDEFSAPEMVRVSHILVSPRSSSAEADREARDRAASILRRLKAGEDFATLAREHTDDVATREAGGDLGLMKRGVMLEPVEQAAFALRAGELSDIVHSEAGYHILKVSEYQPRIAQPLDQIYGNVGARLAGERADTLAGRRADSLLRTLRTPAQARAVARRSGFQVLAYEQPIGQRAGSGDFIAYFRGLDRTKPGQLYPAIQLVPGQGYAITWVDSVVRPRVPTWENAREGAIGRYRRAAGQRAFDAKRAELDSLMAAGWSFDSVGVMFGGLAHAKDLTPGRGVPGVTQGDRLDTLIFGVGGGRALGDGEVSPWVMLANGSIRLRLAARDRPDDATLSRDLTRGIQIETERRMQAAYNQMKKRYPVRILDAKLRDVVLPTLPAP